MTVSVGAAIDNLYAKAQTAVIGITVSGKPVSVVDGEASILEPGTLAIGATQPPPDGAAEVAVKREWSDIGDRYVSEDYTIPCYIDVRVPGKAQKTARDAAEVIFNAFWTQVVADLHLSGAISGGQPVEITDYHSAANNTGTVAEAGRRQLITFGVHCINLTT